MDIVITRRYTVEVFLFVPMTTIQVRTKAGLKKSAQQVLDTLGLDLSTAINMYLVQIVVKQGIPFEIRTENGFTPAQEQEILQEIAWAKKYGKKYTSTKEMFDDILAE